MRVWTGLKDKNGKKIYAGDILYEPSWWWGSGVVEDSVDGQERQWVIRTQDGNITYNTWSLDSVEVVDVSIPPRDIFPTKDIDRDAWNAYFKHQQDIVDTIILEACIGVSK